MNDTEKTLPDVEPGSAAAFDAEKAKEDDLEAATAAEEEEEAAAALGISAGRPASENSGLGRRPGTTKAPRPKPKG